MNLSCLSAFALIKSFPLFLSLFLFLFESNISSLKKHQNFSGKKEYLVFLAISWNEKEKEKKKTRLSDSTFAFPSKHPTITRYLYLSHRKSLSLSRCSPKSFSPGRVSNPCSIQIITYILSSRERPFFFSS